MLRYNHSLVERKWIEFVKQGQQAGEELPRAYTVLVPGDGDGVDLENARLLVLTDFLPLSLGEGLRPPVLPGAEIDLSASWLA